MKHKKWPCKNGNKQTRYSAGKTENFAGNNLLWSAKRIRMCPVVRESENFENRWNRE